MMLYTFFVSLMYHLDCKIFNPVVTMFCQMLGQFIARAIADHILPMSFLDYYKGKVDCEHAR